MVEHFGQQRSPNRGCVRTWKKDQMILGPVWTFISGSLPDKEPVDVRGKFDWSVFSGSLEPGLLSWSRMVCFTACFAFLRCKLTVRSSVLLRMEAVALVPSLESGKIHCWTILGTQELWKVVEARVSCSEDRRQHRKQSLIRWILAVMDGHNRARRGEGWAVRMEHWES